MPSTKWIQLFKVMGNQPFEVKRSEAIEESFSHIVDYYNALEIPVDTIELCQAYCQASPRCSTTADTAFRFDPFTSLKCGEENYSITFFLSFFHSFRFIHTKRSFCQPRNDRIME